MMETPSKIFGINLKQKDLNVIVFIVFLIGLSVRLAGLGSAPFSENEANFALRAGDIARFEPVVPISNAAYLGLTSITFFLKDATAFWARFWPALVGGSLALLPLFWRKQLGTFSVIGISLALALDPVLVTLSRQADGPILALAGLAWGLTFLNDRKAVLAGVSLAVGWLGGLWFWGGLIILTVSWLLVKMLGIQVNRGEEVSDTPQAKKRFLVTFLFSWVISLMLVSSAFMLNPSGVGGIGSGLVGFFSKIFSRQTTPGWASIYRLIAYSSLPLVLGIASSIRLWRQKETHDKALSVLALVALAASVGFIGLGSGGLAFAVIPLWILSVGELRHFFQQGSTGRNVSVGMMLFSLVVLVYLSITLKSFMGSQWGSSTDSHFGGAILAGLILLLLSYVLVGMGWSFQAANKGLFSAILIVLLVSSLSLTFSSIHHRAEFNALVWSGSPVLVSEDEVDQVLGELEQQGTLEPGVSKAVILGDSQDGLAWIFHGFDQVLVLSGLRDGFTPEVIVTAQDFQPEADFAYRGMPFVSQRAVDWNNVSLVDLARGIWIGGLKTTDSTKTLWIRQDLFTGVSN
ncbi:MAG: hypothetical protein WA110_04960 [Anaerolineaceae bacterium]